MESTLKRELLTIKKDAIIITSNISISCAKKIKRAIKIQDPFLNLQNLFTAFLVHFSIVECN